jgi:chemotaxis-related protein WspD
MTTELPLVDDCWNRIGVMGDHSCPELPKVGHCHNCPTFSRAGQALFERLPPDDYVEDWTRRLSQPEEANCEARLAVVVFRLGEEWLCFDVRSCVEVAESRGSHRIPHRSSRLLKGLVNIRGELHLGVCLRELLEIGPSDSPAERLLVVEHRRQRWVFAVEEVAGVQRLPEGCMADVPATVSRSRSAFTRGVFEWEDKRVGLLDEDRVFAALKRNVG